MTVSQVIQGQAEFSIKDLVRFLLEKTSTTDPPTNAERIARYVNLNVRGFFHHEYGLDSSIRAYLWPARKEIGVSRQLTPHRRKFSILHEVGHYVIPGHLDNLDEKEKLLDDARTLSDYSVITVEMQANRFAADCIFQLDRLQLDVDNVDLHWPNVSRIATLYDASIVATVRRWVEESLRPCAFLVFAPVKRKLMTRLRFSYVITSESFRQRYFSNLSRFTLDEDSDALLAYRNTSGYAGLFETLNVDLGNESRVFEMSLFSTQYNVYGLVVPEM